MKNRYVTQQQNIEEVVTCMYTEEPVKCSQLSWEQPLNVHSEVLPPLRSTKTTSCVSNERFIYTARVFAPCVNDCRLFCLSQWSVSITITALPHGKSSSFPRSWRFPLHLGTCLDKNLKKINYTFVFVVTFVFLLRDAVVQANGDV